MRFRPVLLGALIVGAAVSFVASGLPSRSTVGNEASAATAPVIECARRVEPGVKRFTSRRDVIRGPFALVTIARDLPRLSRASYRPRNGRLAGIKLPVGLRAGHNATLSIAPSQRARAALVYRAERHDASRLGDGDVAVAFTSCPADTPAFADDGVVGPTTGWAGALIITGPRCIRLQVRADGRRRPDIRLPLGRRCR